jgi:hypothetical protein
MEIQKDIMKNLDTYTLTFVATVSVATGCSPIPSMDMYFRNSEKQFLQILRVAAANFCTNRRLMSAVNILRQNPANLPVIPKVNPRNHLENTFSYFRQKK